jgi:hypothetical protein
VPNTIVQIECASEKCINVHKNQKKDHQGFSISGFVVQFCQKKYKVSITY